MIERLNKLTNWQAVLIIALVGFAVYFSGLTSQFQGDDLTQIVNNVPVHSISNIENFFEGGTFYDGGTSLIGTYYRPLMTTVFSLLYTVFGPRPLYFHLLQLLLCIGSATVLYLFFRYSFKPVLALFLTLIFLVHPIDSQVVFAIPSMQDALFFFFGMLALYLLLRFNSVRSLIAVAACLLLALLAKETAALFVIMAALYLLLWDKRKRLYWFAGIMVLPITLWLALKTNAIGLLGVNPSNAPIDRINLGGRLMTIPSMVLFYISKFVFPWKLASGYYWVHSTFSFRYFLIPLLLDAIVASLIVYLSFVIKKRAPKAQYFTYVFFATWAILGLAVHLQIIPLDFTASEAWFYFSMAGVMGMIGVILTVFPLRVRPNWLLAIAVLLVGALGLRTELRGFDWKNQATLASRDVIASPDDYVAYNNLSVYYISLNEFGAGELAAKRSVDIFPYYENYNNLAVSSQDLGDYQAAVNDYKHALKYGYFTNQITDNLADLTLVSGTPSSNQQSLLSMLKNYPQDTTIWTCLAILEDRSGDNADARIAMSNAARYGGVNQTVYSGIMNDQTFLINFGGTTIKIP